MIGNVLTIASSSFVGSGTFTQVNSVEHQTRATIVTRVRRAWVIWKIREGNNFKVFFLSRAEFILKVKLPSKKKSKSRARP